VHEQLAAAMNRRLLDPFQSVQLPEIIEEYLEQGAASCMAFNRRGTLLAVGTYEGQVVLWDFDTRGVARTLSRHTKQVTGLSWSRNGRYLASGSADQSLILWDVLNGTQALEVQLPVPITHVSLSARPPYKCVVSFAGGHPPVITDLESSQEQVLPVLADTEATKQGKPGESSSTTIVAIFSKDSSMVFVGQMRGLISVVDASSLRFLDIVKGSNMARYLGLSLNPKGTLLLANCHDRVLRLFEVHAPQQGPHSLSLEEANQALENMNIKTAKPGSLLWGPSSVNGTGVPLLLPVREFQNAVEKMLWAGAVFTSDSEHVVALASSKTQHHLYIWNRVNGKMERILEGPKEGALALAWHPLRTCLLSITAMGRIYIWARHYAENWSAFAPDFKELDENVEYVEREDEFDWQTKGASGHHENMVAQEQAAAAAREGKSGSGPLVEEIDVVTLDQDHTRVFSSDEDDELEDQLHYLPAEVEPEEGAGGPADGDGAAAGPGPGAEGVPLGGVARVDGEGDEVMDGGGAAEVAEAEALDLQAAMLASRAHALELGGGPAGDDADMPMQPQGDGVAEESHQAKKRREMEGTV